MFYYYHVHTAFYIKKSMVNANKLFQNNNGPCTIIELSAIQLIKVKKFINTFNNSVAMSYLPVWT